MQLFRKNSRIEEEYEEIKENYNNTFTNTIGNNPRAIPTNLSQLQQHTTYT